MYIYSDDAKGALPHLDKVTKLRKLALVLDEWKPKGDVTPIVVNNSIEDSELSLNAKIVFTTMALPSLKIFHINIADLTKYREGLCRFLKGCDLKVMHVRESGSRRRAGNSGVHRCPRHNEIPARTDYWASTSFETTPSKTVGPQLASTGVTDSLFVCPPFGFHFIFSGCSRQSVSAPGLPRDIEDRMEAPGDESRGQEGFHHFQIR